MEFGSYSQKSQSMGKGKSQMDFQSYSQKGPKSNNGKGQKGPPRRTWKQSEEHALLMILKELVADGWKCDNGFRNGILIACEGAMAKKYPGCDLKGEPHINSKLHVWKKQYGSLTTMLSRSGFGWNSSANTINVPDDNVWEEYVKADPNARGMRYKTWPYFDDWCMIFGKDRATGERGTSFVETINNLVNGNSLPEAIPLDDDDMGENVNSNPSSQPEGDTTSFSGGESNNSQKSKRKRGAPRTQVQNHEDPKMVEMMERFFRDMHEQIGELISKVGHEHDAAIARRGVFDAMEVLDYLTVDDKLDVAKAICVKKEYVDIFYGLTIENKAAMVQKILRKEW